MSIKKTKSQAKNHTKVTVEDAMQYLNKLNDNPVSLGKAIWSIRMCEEESQVNFAKQIGVSRQYLCDLEHDRKEVSPKQAYKFAKILGYDSKHFVKLALQDLLRRSGMEWEVFLEDVA